MLYMAQYHDLVSGSLGSSDVGLLEIPQAVSRRGAFCFSRSTELELQCNSHFLHARLVKLKRYNVHNSSYFTTII